ncbi:MAG TPA: GIY-YIG nuclease family protein, partial [Candidatus Absconditabacterales bacterium]|nr:GIY-YIG nuclease family protein [Candidatus Absconditabacterales bacterium]
NGGYYIGSTRNVETRFDKHKRGGVRSTKGYRPLKLLYFKRYETYKEAREFEIKLKKYKSKEEVKKFMTSSND